MRLIFEQGSPGRRGYRLPRPDVPESAPLPARFCRGTSPDLPAVSELDVVRHYTRLSRLNFSVDGNFYPLGSCTMKYNPKFTEKIASHPGFLTLHPLLPQLLGGGMLAQGSLEVLWRVQNLLAEITGMDAVTTQPMAGAHGELTGVMIMAAYHRANGDRRRYIIVPDSSHGTNPATASIAGYEVRVIPTDAAGGMDMHAYRAALSPEVAGVMLTCPNTLGLFDPNIREICDLAHAAGALMYCDGANLNAILGICRPGDLGFDVVHLNLHKTFATPHGGGGPGAGPVGVRQQLVPFLPVPVVVRRTDGTFALETDCPQSIGPVAPFYGNFQVLLKALAYILHVGRAGLIEAAEYAVLNANWLRVKLREFYDLPYDRMCMHEFVLSARRQKAQGVSAMDIAKALIDRGFHPPTVYFPLIVPEAMMIEPTETESLQTLTEFVDALREIAQQACTDPETLRRAPVSTPVQRLDEVGAARRPILRWRRERGG